MDIRHMCRSAARSAASAAQAQKRGYIGRARIWDESELALLRQHRHQPELLPGLLPARSARAIEGMRVKLRLTRAYCPWTGTDLAKLRRIYRTMPTAYLLAEFPGRTLKAIQHHAYGMGLKREKPPYKRTGMALLDQVRDRCHAEGYSMTDLDEIASTGNFFRRRTWAKRKTVSGRVVSAAIALGGQVEVAWPDRDG